MSHERTSSGGRDFVARIRIGEPTAEDELVRRYGPPLRAMMLARTRHHEDAEDLAQDALVAVLQALRHGAVASDERLSAFVHGTARNIANNHFRARERHPQEVPLPEDIPAEPVESSLESDERLALALEVLTRQGPLDRTILELSLLGRLTPVEIGKRLHMRADRVRAHKSRAAHRLFLELAASKCPAHAMG